MLPQLAPRNGVISLSEVNEGSLTDLAKVRFQGCIRRARAALKPYLSLKSLTDLAKRVQTTLLAPSYSIEGVGSFAPKPFWPLAAGAS